MRKNINETRQKGKLTKKAILARIAEYCDECCGTPRLRCLDERCPVYPHRPLHRKGRSAPVKEIRKAIRRECRICLGSSTYSWCKNTRCMIHPIIRE